MPIDPDDQVPDTPAPPPEAAKAESQLPAATPDENCRAPALAPAFEIRPGRILLYGTAGVVGVVLAFALTFVFVAKPIAAKSATKGKENPTEQAAATTVTADKTETQLRMPPPAEATLTRPETSVLVMNGSGERGGAKRVAAELEEQGYTVVGFDNAPNQNYRRTVVLYTNGTRGEAERLARDEQVPRRRVSPVDGMNRNELRDADVVLILGL